MRKGLDNQTSGQNWWGESICASLPWPCRGMWAADTGGSSAVGSCREQLLLHRPRKAHQRRNTILDSEDISQPFLLISLIFTAVTWQGPTKDIPCHTSCPGHTTAAPGTAEQQNTTHPLLNTVIYLLSCTRYSGTRNQQWSYLSGLV